MIKLIDILNEIKVVPNLNLDYSDIGPYEAVGKYDLFDEEGIIVGVNQIISICKLGKQYSCLTPGAGPIYIISNKYLEIRDQVDTWFIHGEETKDAAARRIFINAIKSGINKKDYTVLKPQSQVNEVKVVPPSKFKVGQEVIDTLSDLEGEITKKYYWSDAEKWIYVLESEDGQRWEVRENFLKILK